MQANVLNFERKSIIHENIFNDTCRGELVVVVTMKTANGKHERLQKRKRVSKHCQVFPL
jgi:hypothetical protein